MSQSWAWLVYLLCWSVGKRGAYNSSRQFAPKWPLTFFLRHRKQDILVKCLVCQPTQFVLHCHSLQGEAQSQVKKKLDRHDNLYMLIYFRAKRKCIDVHLHSPVESTELKCTFRISGLLQHETFVTPLSFSHSPAGSIERSLQKAQRLQRWAPLCQALPRDRQLCIAPLLTPTALPWPLIGLVL